MATLPERSTNLRALIHLAGTQSLPVLWSSILKDAECNSKRLQALPNGGAFFCGVRDTPAASKAHGTDKQIVTRHTKVCKAHLD